jgi:hypothetical protein
MRFAHQNAALTREAHFLDRRSAVGLKDDGSLHIRLFGLDMSHLRERVFARDQNCCVDCGSSYWLQLSHDVPRSMGGGDTEDNTHARCIICHRKKDLHGMPGHF